MTRKTIVIDTDPGQDDAVAILLALASPELDVAAITAVAGNVPLATTSHNARKLCELAGRPDVTVAAGADRPLLRILVTAEHIHGDSGMHGWDLPDATMPLDPRHGAQVIVETVMARPERSVTLCVLGPLTNVAQALIREPRVGPRLAGIVLMGGAHFAGGNVTPNAEFNIYVDPEAARLVFGAGIPLTVIPLDCTHRALTNRARVARIAALGTPAGNAVAGWLGSFERLDTRKYGREGGPLHDPCVIAYLLDPGIFQGKQVNVEVETASDLTRGMTVMDWWGVTGRAPNAHVLSGLDADRFFELITDRISMLGSRPARPA